LELVYPNGIHSGPFERFEGIDLFSRYRTSNQKGIAFVQILIISVTLIVVAVPEGTHVRYMLLGFALMSLVYSGLPLAVTLALAFATKSDGQTEGGSAMDDKCVFPPLEHCSIF
jgi:hypothetical protein